MKSFLSSLSLPRCPYLAILSFLSSLSFPRHPFLAVLTSLSFPSFPRHPFLAVLTSLSLPSFPFLAYGPTTFSICYYILHYVIYYKTHHANIHYHIDYNHDILNKNIKAIIKLLLGPDRNRIFPPVPEPSVLSGTGLPEPDYRNRATGTGTAGFVPGTGARACKINLVSSFEHVISSFEHVFRIWRPNFFKGLT